MTRKEEAGIHPGCRPWLVTSRRPRGSVTLANWQDGPWNRWSYQHIAELIPSCRIKRGEATLEPLPRQLRDVDGIEFEAVDGATKTVVAFLEDSWTDGFLVLHEGQIAAERYFNGMEPHALHLLQSVSKSITGALAGALVVAGPSRSRTTGRRVHARARWQLLRGRYGASHPGHDGRDEVLRRLRRPRLGCSPL